MKKALLATSAIIAAGAIAANAHAVDVDMYGQVNKGVMMFDDGKTTEFNIVDNDVSSTRFGLRGSQALDHGLTASVLFEGEMQSNASDAVNQTTYNNGASTFTERHARVGLAGSWGAVFVGHTSSATDGITEIDLAPVQDVLGSGADRIGGALKFRNSSGTLSSIAVNNVVDNFDGIAHNDGTATNANTGDRLNVIRFDSAIYNGVQGRIAAATGGDIDAAVVYNGKMDAFEVAGGVGYVAYNNTTSATTNQLDHQISGSVSVKHDSGVSATAAYGQRSLDNKAAGVSDPDFYYVKLGYAWDQFGIAADYSKNENIDVSNATDDKTTVYGLGGQYDLGHGVSLAAYYRNIDLSRSGTATDAIDMYGLNMRVKF